MLDVQGEGRGIGRSVDAPLARQPQLIELLWFCVFVVAYYAAYHYGMTFSRAMASPFWFPDSVLLCALLRTQPRRWPFLVLATVPIRLFSEVADSIPTWYLATCIANDGIKGVLTALALRRWMKNPLRIDTLRDLAVYCAFAVVLGSAASAVVGATVRAALGGDYWLTFAQWFFGSALTQLVVTPFILYWVFGAAGLIADTRRTLEATVLAAGLVVTCILSCMITDQASIYIRETGLYAPVPFLFWAAIRFGMTGATGAIAVKAFIMIGMELMGGTRFAGLSPNEAMFALQNFLLLRAVPLYLVATVLERGKAAEQAMRESEARFREMADTTPALLWMSDREGGCVFANNIYQEFIGKSLDEVVGDGWARSVHPDDQRYCVDTWKAALAARKPFVAEFRVRRHDGAWRWVRNTASPRITPDGEFLGYIGSGVDVTDRRHAEETIDALIHVQRLAAMGELTVAFAHEVKQPLAAILSNAGAAMHLLESDDPSAAHEIREALIDIRSDDLRANEIIDRIRQFAHRTDRRLEPVNLNATVADVLRMIKGDVRRRSVRIHTDLATSLPFVLADQTQLQQVLLNLIVNSMDAMDETAVDARRLNVRTRAVAGAAEISVVDSGPGVPTDKLPSLFDSFFTTKTDGTGLGLAVARSIVIAHHGEIKVENNATGGATFSFTVPFAEGAISDSAASRGRTNGQTDDLGSLPHPP